MAPRQSAHVALSALTLLCWNHILWKWWQQLGVGRYCNHRFLSFCDINVRRMAKSRRLVPMPVKADAELYSRAAVVRLTLTMHRGREQGVRLLNQDRVLIIKV